MQFSSALVALLSSSTIVSAAPSFSKRQTTCSTTYGCPFEITVAGCAASQLEDGQLRVANSSISEISDGQVRCDLNGTTPTNFTLSNGQVTDAAGRVCEISSQDQFQCSATPDAGATTTGFSVCNGLLAFNSNSSFIACLATGSIPGYNIYTANVDRSTVTNCMPVELDVPSCAVSSSSCVASTVTATVTPAAVTVSETQTIETTVTPAAVTVTATQPAETVSATVTSTIVSIATTTATATQSAQVVTVTDTDTITQPASTYTVTDTLTQSAQSVTVTDTITQPAQTITITATAAPVVQQSTVVVPMTTTASSAQPTCTNIARSLGSSNFPTTIDVVNENTDQSGSSYFGYIGNGNSTIFTFNAIGSSGECSIGFYFPTEAEIQAVGGTTSYDISSSSIAVTLYELDSVAAVTDTYATKPARGASYSATLTPGTNTTFSTFTCASGQTSYELTASDSNTLSFFEDYNLPILGLVVSSC